MVALARHLDQTLGLPADIQRIAEAPSGAAMIEVQVSLQARLNPEVWAVARALDAVRRTDTAAERAWQDRLDDRLRGCRGIVARLDAEGNLRPGLDASIAADLPVDDDVAADVGGPRARPGLVAEAIPGTRDAVAARDADARRRVSRVAGPPLNT